MLIILTVAAVPVGMLLGSVSWGFSADGIGRKMALLASLIIHVTFGVLAVVIPYKAPFLVCTFLSAVGLVYLLCFADMLLIPCFMRIMVPLNRAS